MALTINRQFSFGQAFEVTFGGAGGVSHTFEVFVDGDDNRIRIRSAEAPPEGRPLAFSIPCYFGPWADLTAAQQLHVRNMVEGVLALYMGALSS